MSTKTVIDCSDGSVTVVNLTPEEIEEIEQRNIAFEAQQIAETAAREAKAAAKTSAEAKLTALGLTLEEITAL
jgi:hypothetical protein